MAPLRFTSLDKFELKDRGLVFVVCSDSRYNVQTQLLGKIVFIDDVRYLCKGVERYLKPYELVEPGEEIGLLVGPWTISLVGK